jgi:hypothetical protein
MPPIASRSLCPVHGGSTGYGCAGAGRWLRQANRADRPLDGVPHGIKESVVIAIFGIGPVDIRLADPHLPPWRQV